jgi:hypothetical protein
LETVVIQDLLDLPEKLGHEVPPERILETLVRLVQKEILAQMEELARLGLRGLRV